MSRTLLASVVFLTLHQTAAPQFLDSPRPVDLVRGHGYEAEELPVVTEDGYQLTLTHMRSRDTRRPVLMVHGVLTGADQWVIRGPGQDLAYSLVDNGHDVWLADLRGNTFSRGHVTFSVREENYWNFSFHESGLYDLPAFIDTVLRRSGSEQLLYVGHSMGTTVHYVMCSLRPRYNQLIHTAVHLSPVAFRKPLSPLLALVSSHVESIAESLKRSKTYEFFRRNRAVQDLGISVCINKEHLCRYLIGQLYGETSAKNATKLIGYASRAMSGTSVKNMQHLTQLYKSKNFTLFDYGKRRNFEIYGSKTPPSYPLERVTTPVVLVYSGHDVFVDTQSVSRLAAHLPNVITKTYIPKFDHIDFLFSDDAFSLVYKRIIKLFSNT